MHFLQILLHPLLSDDRACFHDIHSTFAPSYGKSQQMENIFILYAFIVVQELAYFLGYFLFGEILRSQYMLKNEPKVVQHFQPSCQQYWVTVLNL